MLTQIKALICRDVKMAKEKGKLAMYNKILVPVSFDADRNAEGAMEIAQTLCADSGTIICLHVLEQLPSYATQYLSDEHIKSAQKDIVESLKNLVEGVPNATIEVVTGHSALTILDTAKRDGADLIIIASHRPGMQDYLIGSTAAKVVRHAKCAVHVLR